MILCYEKLIANDNTNNTDENQDNIGISHLEDKASVTLSNLHETIYSLYTIMDCFLYDIDLRHLRIKQFA